MVGSKIAVFRMLWRKRASPLWVVTFENEGEPYIAIGRNNVNLPVYRQDRNRCVLVPMDLTYPDCFETMPAALMTSCPRRRRLTSILREYGTLVEESRAKAQFCAVFPNFQKDGESPASMAARCPKQDDSERSSRFARGRGLRGRTIPR